MRKNKCFKKGPGKKKDAETWKDALETEKTYLQGRSIGSWVVKTILERSKMYTYNSEHSYNKTLEVHPQLFILSFVTVTDWRI